MKMRSQGAIAVSCQTIGIFEKLYTNVECIIYSHELNCST
jgi:hypothetical protein